jgi:glycosyltransferase involved in cell wall biosynthesis
MKVLIVHNKYKIAGGEDIQTNEEFQLLKQNGVEVELFFVSNNEVDSINPLKLAYNTIWSSKYYKLLLEKIRKNKYDIVHVQNFFPLLSPSIFHAAKKAGTKVIMTAHNYRLICPNALMFIDNKICKDCLGKTIPYPAIFKRCYRDSISATTITVSMLGVHNVLNTWKSKIDGIICISEFVKKQLMAGGFDEKKLHIKYNFVSSSIEPSISHEDYYIFVGRTSDQKGIHSLLEVFQKIQKKLIIVGEGPLDEKIQEVVSRTNNIEFLGKLSLEQTYQKIARAKAIVVPSQSNEPFGRTIAEAFAHGTPVIASALGGITELVRDGENGFLFDPYKEGDFLNTVLKYEEIKLYHTLRKNAFASYKQNFTTDLSFKTIMNIYQRVLSSLN